jgi:hypothetical protein
LVHSIVGAIFLKDIMNAVHYLHVLKNNFYHSYKLWVSILREHFLNRTGLDCIQQMQCWMLPIIIFVTEFCLINFLHVLTWLVL